MKQRILVALLTALIFCAGYAAGLYTERHQALPAPPVTVPFMVEFNGGKGTTEVASRPTPHPIDRKELQASILALKPELDSFLQRVDDIDARFEKALDALLTPEQRVKHAAELNDEVKRRRDHAQREENRPITEDQLNYLLREQPSHTLLWYVILSFPLDQQTKRYSLDPEQREKARVLLRERRDRYLELVDSSPTPSVKLSRLSTMVQRLSLPLPPGVLGPDAPVRSAK